MYCHVKLWFKQCHGVVSGLCMGLVAPDSHASVSLIRANCIPSSSADKRYVGVISAWRLHGTFLWKKKKRLWKFKRYGLNQTFTINKEWDKSVLARLRSQAHYSTILRLDQGNKKQVLLTYKWECWVTLLFTVVGENYVLLCIFNSRLRKTSTQMSVLSLEKNKRP